MSSSTAKMLFDELPLLFGLKRPKNWLGFAVEKFVVGDMKKTMPWPLRFAYGEIMAKIKVVEKEKMLPAGDWRNGILFGKNACPFCCCSSMVSFKRPFGVIDAAPSRLKLASLNPLLKMKL